MSGPTWTWKTHAISCYLPTCEDAKEACVRTLAPLPDGFAHCVSRAGIHACPASWTAKELVAARRSLRVAEPPGPSVRS